MATPTQVPKQTERHTQTNAHRTQKEVSWEEGAEQDSEMKTGGEEAESASSASLALSFSRASFSSTHVCMCASGPV